VEFERRLIAVVFMHQREGLFNLFVVDDVSRLISTRGILSRVTSVVIQGERNER